MIRSTIRQLPRLGAVARHMPDSRPWGSVVASHHHPGAHLRTSIVTVTSFSLATLFVVSPALAADLFEATEKVNVIVPAADTISGVRSVEVANFSGFEGDQVAASVRAALLDDNRGEAKGKFASRSDGFRVNVYEVVTTGADAKVSGKTDVEEETEDYKAKQAKKDSKGNTVKDSKGDTVYEEVSCKRRNVKTTTQYSFTLANGEVKSTGSLGGSASDSECGDDVKNLDSKDALASKALAGVGYGVANSVAPRWAVWSVDLSRDKSIKDSFKLAKDGEWERAMCGFRATLQTDAYNVDAMYNLGAMLELHGYNAQADEMYQKAIKTNGHKNATEGAARVAKRATQVAGMVAAYGFSAPPSTQDYAACGTTASGGAGRPVELKKETALLGSPEAGAPSIATLPKNMRLVVLDETGKLWKVQTPDGVEGWVDAKAVK